MKYKEILKYIVPEILFDLYRICKRIFFYIKNSDIIKKNTKLKKISQGQTCIFLGNGPSLKINKVINLDQYDVFVCNDFFQVEGARKVAVKFYLNFDVSDAWIENIKSYLKITCPKYFIFSMHSKPKIDNSDFHKFFPAERTFIYKLCWKQNWINILLTYPDQFLI